MRTSIRILTVSLLLASTAAAASEPPAGDRPPRPLTERGRENLVALTRLLGYVRYFHPSDQAAKADWGALAIAGVSRVEPAAGPEQLAASLERLFRPVAPSVRVFPTGATADRPAPRPPGEPSSLAWLHHWESQRVDTSDPAAAGEAHLRRTVDVAGHDGKT